MLSLLCSALSIWRAPFLERFEGVEVQLLGLSHELITNMRPKSPRPPVKLERPKKSKKENSTSKDLKKQISLQSLYHWIHSNPASERV